MGSGDILKNVPNCIQSAILNVERRSYDRGFQTSCYMLDTRKERPDNVQLKRHGQNMERGTEFKLVV